MPHVFVGTQPRKKVLSAAAAPLLAYHGGALIPNVRLITVYWGSAWVADPVRSALDEFANFFVTSPLLDQLAEYNVPDQTIGHGTHAQTFLDTSDPPATLADTDIQAYLQRQIAQGRLESPDANTIYAVFLPSGVTVVLEGQASCQQFCGYHSATPDNSLVYIVDTYDDCFGCQFAPDTLGSSTVVFSHELCEAITDPHLDGWFDDATGLEIGDICEGQSKVLTTSGAVEVPPPTDGVNYTVAGQASADADGKISAILTLTPQGSVPSPTPPPPTGQSWVVQREWSNQAGACV